MTAASNPAARPHHAGAAEPLLVVDNKWIGQRISDPDIDMATIARGQGAKGFGPCRNAGELEKALKEAVAVVEAGGVAVVDARILGGYSPATAAAMARGKADRGT